MATKKKTANKAAAPHGAFRRKMVEKFVKKESIVWPREMKIASKLLVEEPDFGVWAELDLAFEVNSLAYFLTDKGRELLEEEKSRRTVNKERENFIKKDKPATFADTKVGEDTVQTTSVRSFQDYLKSKR